MRPPAAVGAGEGAYALRPQRAAAQVERGSKLSARHQVGLKRPSGAGMRNDWKEWVDGTGLCRRTPGRSGHLGAGAPVEALYDQRSLSRRTNLSPDHTCVMAHTFTSTSPAASP